MNAVRLWLTLIPAMVSVLAAAPPARQSTQQPFIGVTYIERSAAEPRPVRIHVAQIDLRAPGLRFKVSPPGGNREVIRQSTLEFARQERAQLAINGHFFLPFPSRDRTAWVIGLGASDGRVFSAFESPEQSYALVAFAPALNIDRDNYATIVNHDARVADARHVREPVTLWNVIAGSSQIVTAGVATVPVYRDDNHFDGQLDPGGPNAYSNHKPWADVTTARTAIGLSQDRRTMTLFTVDARGGSEGMTLSEVATVMIRDFNVFDALNLDGGGSTTMVMEGPDGRPSIVNVSADNPAGRSVATSLAVFARRRR
ncbi:MAG TPA: phosphodiester glycosidase family protein [Vicinamibacterales bacterium]|nr:phosphodiester glycosidase family protein [Vicinamibacterales bacterium]